MESHDRLYISIETRLGQGGSLSFPVCLDTVRNNVVAQIEKELVLRYRIVVFEVTLCTPLFPSLNLLVIGFSR